MKTNPKLLQILLEDKSSGRNILWATDNYKKHGMHIKRTRLNLLSKNM